MENENAQIKLMLAYLCISNEAEASLVRKVEILDRFDLTVKEIATVCGVATQSVMNARQMAKQHTHAKTKK